VAAAVHDTGAPAFLVVWNCDLVRVHFDCHRSRDNLGLPNRLGLGLLNSRGLRLLSQSSLRSTYACRPLDNFRAPNRLWSLAGFALGFSVRTALFFPKGSFLGSGLRTWPSLS
jgi:hypothetical protein